MLQRSSRWAHISTCDSQPASCRRRGAAAAGEEVVSCSPKLQAAEGTAHSTPAQQAAKQRCTKGTVWSMHGSLGALRQGATPWR